jgi:hypothetical protein
VRKGVISKASIWTGIVAVTLVLGYIDWITGIELNFFAFYFIPVGLAAWHLGFGSSAIVAGLSATMWFIADYGAGHVYSAYVFAIWNTLIRLASFVIIGWTLSRIRQMLLKEQATSQDLRQAMSQVKVLEGILPICASCKKIRTDSGNWVQIEHYLSQKTSAEFTHGLCPQCGKKLLEEAGMTVDETST